MIARATFASDLFQEITVDGFAGGGGASIGIEQAIPVITRKVAV